MHFIFASSLVTSGPPESGYEIANHAILDGLRRQGAKVTEIGFKWVGSELSDPENTICLGDVDVKTDGAPLAQKLRWLGEAILSGTTFASAKLRIVKAQVLEAAIEQAEQRHGSVAGIIVNGVALAGAFEKVLTRRDFIYVAHNVEHISAAQNADDAASPIEKLMYRREARYLKALEARLCSKARFVLTLSEEDRAGLEIEDDRRSESVPLVTPQGISSTVAHPMKAFDVGLIGTWTWTPNRIGLEWFLRQIVPQLPADFSIAIAGKTPKGMRARDERVKFLGRVLDAKEFVKQSHVMALTSRVGTGVQLKTIEAFEMGLPCVATKSSMRGIAFRPDNVVVADKDTTFAEALSSQVQAARAGTLPVVDGEHFRNQQRRRMDAVLAKALKVFADG